MYDLIHYRDELRGFYLDVYHDLPGDIIEDENQLLEEIKKGYDYQRLDKFNHNILLFYQAQLKYQLILMVKLLNE